MNINRILIRNVKGVHSFALYKNLICFIVDNSSRMTLHIVSLKSLSNMKTGFVIHTED